MVGSFPDHVLKKFVHVFSHLQYDIIFKYPGDQIDGITENIHLVNWMPQNDLLAHPNLKLFITHGGLNSIIEAVYNKVPVIAFPFGFDQHSNSAFLQSRKMGLVMKITQFTEEEVITNIENIIEDATYAENIERASNIMKDMQANNMSNPVYWIEHVIKYGASHLRSNAYQLPLYQYLMLDVIGLGLFFLIAIIVVVWSLLKCCCQFYVWSCRDYRKIGRQN